MLKNYSNSYKSNILFELKLYIKSIKLKLNKSGQINLEFYTNKNKLLEDATFFINSNENQIKTSTCLIIPMIIEYDKRLDLFKPVYLNIKMNFMSSNYNKEATNFKINLSKIWNEKFNYSKIKVNFKNLKDKNNIFEFLLDYNFIGTIIDQNLFYFNNFSNYIQTYLLDNDINNKKVIKELKNQLNIPSFLFETYRFKNFNKSLSPMKSLNNDKTDCEKSIISYKTNINRYLTKLSSPPPKINLNFEKSSSKFIKKPSPKPVNYSKLNSLNFEEEEKALTIIKQNKNKVHNLKLQDTFNFKIANFENLTTEKDLETTKNSFKSFLIKDNKKFNNNNFYLLNKNKKLMEDLQLLNEAKDKYLIKNQELKNLYRLKNLEIKNWNNKINDLYINISEVKNEKNKIYDKLFELGYDDVINYLNGKIDDVYDVSNIL